MQHRKKLFPLLFLACMLVVQVQAQTAAELFRKVNASYAKSANLGMDVQYSLFTNYTSVTPYESSTGSYIRQGNNFYSRLLGITTVQNKTYRVSVSTDNQTIIVSDPLAVEKAPSLLETDSMLKTCTSTEILPGENGSKRCVLHFEKAPFSEFDRIEIEVNASSFVTKMTLFYRAAVNLDESNPALKKEKPRLEISYSNISTSPVINEGQFSEKPFIVTNGKQITSNAAYSTYRILNHKK